MKYFLPVVLFVTSIVACWQLFVHPFYTSHDGEGHVIRMEEFSAALSEGQFPVKLAKRINRGLGYPFFTFNYPLIYYVSAGFQSVGATAIESFKALLVLSMLLRSAGIYVWLIPWYGVLPALAAGIMTILSPYVFLNMYVRADVAESIGLSLLPWLFWSIDRSIERKRYAGAFFVTVSSILILSHNTTVLIAVALAAIYAAFRLRQTTYAPEIIKSGITSLIVIACLTAWFWLPALVEMSSTRLVELREDYVNFFPTIREAIYSPWGFGGYKPGDIPGKMSPQLGLIQFAVFVIGIAYMGIRRMQKKKWILSDQQSFVWILIGLSTFFLSTSVSRFLWDAIPLLQYVQIPWRFVGITTLAACVLCAYIIQWFRSQNLKILSIVFLTAVLLYANRNHIRINLSVPEVSPFTSQEIYEASTTSKDEHIPRKAVRVYENPQKSGTIDPLVQGISTREVWESDYHRFEVTLSKDGWFRDNTLYYQGWTAFIDGVPTNIHPDLDQFYRLRVNVPAGTHTVEFLLRDPWYRIFAYTVSITSVVFLFIRYMVIRMHRMIRKRT